MNCYELSSTVVKCYELIEFVMKCYECLGLGSTDCLGFKLV